MPSSLKAGIILLVLVSIVSLGASAALFFINEGEKSKRISLETRLNDVLKLKDGLEEKLGALEKINEQLESEVASAGEKIEGLTRQYTREKEARELLMTELEKEKEEAKRLAGEVIEEKEEKVGLVQKLARAESECQKMKERLETIVQAKETLEAKVKEIIAQRGVELGKIVIQTDSSPSAESAPQLLVSDNPAYIDVSGAGKEESADGEVLVVNKKFDFVIVNLGKLDGLKAGGRIGIYREGGLLAEAEVEKLYDRMSAATISPQYEKANIKVGDRVYISAND